MVRRVYVPVSSGTNYLANDTTRSSYTSYRTVLVTLIITILILLSTAIWQHTREPKKKQQTATTEADKETDDPPKDGPQPPTNEEEESNGWLIGGILIGIGLAIVAVYMAVKHAIWIEKIGPRAEMQRLKELLTKAEANGSDYVAELNKSIAQLKDDYPEIDFEEKIKMTKRAKARRFLVQRFASKRE
jgi:hypothetical protein